MTKVDVLFMKKDIGNFMLNSYSEHDILKTVDEIRAAGVDDAIINGNLAGIALYSRDMDGKSIDDTPKKEASVVVSFADMWNCDDNNCSDLHNMDNMLSNAIVLFGDSRIEVTLLLRTRP